MKKLLISMGMLWFIVTISAQTDNIYNFQQQNPEVEFISLENFNNLSSDEINLMNNKFIVFNHKIEETDHTSYSQSNQVKSIDNTPAMDTDMSVEEKDWVKIWLTNHPHLKIVKQSEYQALSYEDKIVYQSNHCLILIGEIVTLTDIELYPY